MGKEAKKGILGVPEKVGLAIELEERVVYVKVAFRGLGHG